jgi:opacity protein-like surface antigen
VLARALASAAALLAACAAAAADSPPPLTVPDLVGARTLALQAGVGSASATEALFLNPAAIAARKRYTVDAFYLTDRRPGLSGAARQQDDFGGSVVDSVSTPVAAGMAYLRSAKGLEKGTLLRLALAGPVADRLFLGVQGNYFDLSGAERVASTLNMDAGLLYQATELVSVGASGFNLFSARHREVMPRGFGAGIAVGSDASLQAVADWHVDLDRGGWDAGSRAWKRTTTGSSKSTNRWSAGVEYMVSGSMPVRAGYQIDDTSKTRWWSLGLGLTSTKAALDLGYRQSTTDPRARTLAVALRVFVPNE